MVMATASSGVTARTLARGSKAACGPRQLSWAVGMSTALLAGGVYGDRLPRHHVMVASASVQCISQAATAAFVLNGSVAPLAMISLQALFGAADGFVQPTQTGVVPLMR